MRTLFTSDWHLDAVTAGHERFKELEATAWSIARECVEQKFDAFVFCGDLCDPGTSRSYRAISVAIEIASYLTKAKVHNYWLAGNHDVIEDGHGTSTLSPLQAATRGIESSYSGLVIANHPVMLKLESRDETSFLHTLFLPYTPRSHAYDPVAELKRLHQQGAKFDLFVGHLNIEGITPGSETNDMPRGRDVFLPWNLIRECWPDAIIVNGHYHEAQEWLGRFTQSDVKKGKVLDGSRGVHIPGSIARLTFGESDHRPSFMTLEVK